MISQNFIVLSVILLMIGNFSYIRDTVRGKTRPNRVTWFFWALAPILAFSGEVDKGVGWVATITFTAGIGPLMIFISSFVNKKSYWKLTKFDISCGALALFGLVLWLLLGEGNIAIAMAITADLVAALPTLIKSYNKPKTESSLAFLLASTAAGITLLATDSLSFAHIGFPIYMLVLCGTLFILIRFEVGPKISGLRA